MSRRAKAEVLLALTALIWGSSFVIVKAALADIPPFPFIAARFTLAGLLMLLVMARGHLPRATMGPGLLLGALLFLGYAFQTYGLVYTTPAKSAFITGSSVILVPLISLFHGYRLRIASAGGALLGLVGLYYLVLPSGVGSVNRGDVLTLFGAIAFAVHIVLVGNYTSRFSVRHLAPIQILIVAGCAIVVAAFTPSTVLQIHWTWRMAAAIVVTALFATAFAFSAQVWAQQYTLPAHTALIFSLEPVFAALASRIVLKEHLAGTVLLGSGLILAGMVISEVWGGAPPTPIEG